jgi:hypothetical protein
MLLRYPVQLMVIATSLMLSGAAMAQSPFRVENESRDAAAAFVGTENFMIGRIGRDCMSVLGRMETPQQFVETWQRRNSKYYVASIRYMGKRLDEALAEGGTAKRDTVLAAYTANIQSSGDASAKNWLSRGDRKQACERAVTVIESGANDITPKLRMFGELEALADWAGQQFPALAQGLLSLGTYRIEGRCSRILPEGSKTLPDCAHHMGIAVRDAAKPTFLLSFVNDGKAWAFITKAQVASGSNRAVYTVEKFYDMAGNLEFAYPSGECEITPGPTVRCAVWEDKDRTRLARELVFAGSGEWRYQQ